MKTLVLGIGNPILSDDGLGLEVVEVIKRRLRQGVGIKYTNIEVRGVCSGGLCILDEICGYERLILIDSIKTNGGIPGEVYKLKLDDLGNTSHLSLSHGVDFPTVVKLGKKIGYRIPESIDIFAVEIENNITFCEECTEKVKMRIPEIAQEIMEMADLM